MRLVSIQAAANRKLKAPDFGTRPARPDIEQPAVRPAAVDQMSESSNMRSTQRQLRVVPNAPQQLRLQQLSAPKIGDSSSHTAVAPRIQGGTSGNVGSGAGRSSNSDGGASQDDANPLMTSSAGLSAASFQATTAPQLPGPASHDAAAAERPQAADSREGSGLEASVTPIRDLLQERSIVLRLYVPGQHNGLLCPQCQGGSNREASFNVHIEADGSGAQWICHRATCGFEGGVSAITERRKGSQEHAGDGETFSNPCMEVPC
jgi:hypothetical protein